MPSEEEIIRDDLLENMDVVQIRLYLDFSDESEKALRIVWEVAESLLEKNIWVEIEPIHYWFNDPINTEIYDFPKIVINGKTMFIGRAPSKQELVEAIMDRIGKYINVKLDNEPISLKEYRDGFCEAVTHS